MSKVLQINRDWREPPRFNEREHMLTTIEACIVIG